jgi:hypothetical protein
MVHQPSKRAGWTFLRTAGEPDANGRLRYAPGLILTEDEACVFLLMSAYEYAAVDCQETGCDICKSFVEMWHSVYSALSASKRLAVEETLSDSDTRTPAVPEGF